MVTCKMHSFQDSDSDIEMDSFDAVVVFGVISFLKDILKDQFCLVLQKSHTSTVGAVPLSNSRWQCSPSELH